MATNKIKIKRSTTTTIPTSLDFGELAMSDVANKVRFFAGDNGGSPVEVGGDNKMNIVNPAVAGNLLSTDASGQAVDSGVKINDQGTTTSDLLTAAAILERFNNQPTGMGAGVNFFLSDAPSLSGYETLSRSAVNGTPASATITVTSTTPTLIRAFLSPELNITKLNADIWAFNFFASCNVLQNTSNLTIEVYKYSNTAVETLLFTVSNGDINSTTAVLVNIEKTEAQYTLLKTDRILVKVLGSTTHNSAVDITLYYNDQDKNSHFHAPIQLTHNNLEGLNEGDFLHLSQAEKTSATRYASTSQDGLLNNTDWNTFNNKQNLIASPTNNHLVFTDTTGQTIDSGYAIETTLTGNANFIPSSAAIKNSIEIAKQGLDTKQSVLAATVSPLPAVTPLGAGSGKTLTAQANGVLTIDGINIWIDVANDSGSTDPYATTTRASRVLINNQSIASNNGIYVVTNKGSSTIPFVLTRAIDADGLNKNLNSGAYVFVESGTVNANAGFVLNTLDPITIDTTALNFTQFSGAGQITAGNGISKNANTISALADTTSTNATLSTAIDVNANGIAIKVDNSTITGGGATSLSVKNQGITATQIANATITTSQISATAGILGTQLATNTVANSNLAQVGANTWKGNNTNATTDVSDNLTSALTEATSSVLTITGGTNAVLNATSIEVKQATTIQSGYVSSTDWNIFNNKISIDATQILNATGSITSWNSFVLVSGNNNITLPTPTGNSGKSLKIYKTDSGLNTTILPASGLINGSSNFVMPNIQDAIVVETDGTDYYIVSEASATLDGGSF